ncbi:MAG: adenylate kinase [Elusimicrobia bacterium]|nr:adenylate kinase [Elusimicrobiota bacterium]
MNFILLGCPGAGKGTIAPALCEKLNLLHFSTGNIFREEVSKKTALGTEIEQILKDGRLVPDEVVCRVVKDRALKETRGFLFDGFPRTINQAKGLKTIFEQTKRNLDAVIFLNLEEAEVIKRLTARRTCSKCAAVYNLNTKRPSKEGVCDKCGGALAWREDDNETAVKQRLLIYRKSTAPLADYYKSSAKFIEIDGIGSPEEVTQRVLSRLSPEFCK